MTQAQDTILYVFDPMCGWCYGFSEVIKKAEADFREDFRFDVLSGGMIVGEREGPIGDFAEYILTAYKRVEEYSGVKFGEPYIDQLKTKTLFTSSVKPSIALEVIRTYHPDKLVQFASDLQQAHFKEGFNLNEDSVYKPLAIKYNINPDEFIANLHKPDFIHAAKEGFTKSAELGITGFPAVLGKKHGQWYILTRGFTDYSSFKITLEKFRTL